MSGVSASHLVLFIASIVVAAGVAGTLVTQVDRVSTSIVDQSEDVEEQIETDIRIINDLGEPTSIYDDGNELTLLVKNTGETELRTDREAVDVLVEGQFNEPSNVTRVGSETVEWPPGTVVEVTVEDIEIDGETRLTVAVNGNEDTIRFSV